MRELTIHKQSGALLIEALISMLIFSLGILALVGLQANAIKQVGDARLRMEASYLASQIIAQMWVDRTNLSGYAHMTGGSNCNFTGSVATSANMTAWRGVLGNALPNATAQLLFVPGSANTGTVTVTVCWRAPQETSTHNFVSTTFISGQPL